MQRRYTAHSSGETIVGLFLSKRRYQDLFKKVMKHGLIKLLEPRRLAEVDKTDNPEYCLNLQLISNSIEDCVVKGRAQELLDKTSSLFHPSGQKHLPT